MVFGGILGPAARKCFFLYLIEHKGWVKVVKTACQIERESIWTPSLAPTAWHLPCAQFLPIRVLGPSP